MGASARSHPATLEGVTNMARSAILVEDNIGGLHMVVADNGRCIEAASNLEMAAPGRMLADLRAALAGGMGGWQDRAEDPQSLHGALWR